VALAARHGFEGGRQRIGARQGRRVTEIAEDPLRPVRSRRNARIGGRPSASAASAPCNPAST